MIYPQAVTLKQLRAFAAIVARGNFSAAADWLGVTGPAVSAQIRSLEANLGVELLQRGPSGRVGLTDFGTEVLRTAHHIEGALGLCINKVQSLKEGFEGNVALGAVSTGKYFTPGLVAMAGRDLPRVRIGLRIGNRGEIIEALRNREIELAIMGRPPRAPLVDADLLGDHPHVLIAAPDHPLAGTARDVSPEALLGETFLTREDGSGTRILMERYLDRIGGGLAYGAVEMGTNETIKQAVMAGLGVALISAHAVVAEIETGRLATIRAEGLPIVRRWFLVRRSAEKLAPVAERLRTFIRGLDGAFLPNLARPEG